MMPYIYFPELGSMVNTCIVEKVNNEFNRVCVHCGKDLSGIPAYPVGNGWQCVDNCFDEDYFQWLEVISLGAETLV